MQFHLVLLLGAQMWATALATPGTWGSWFSEEQGWSTDQFSAITGVQCRNRYCDDMRLKVYSDGDIQGSQRPNASYVSVLFSEDRTSTKAECRRGYMVTRVWCGGAYCDDIKLRCTKLEGYTWADISWRYWTEALSEENDSWQRSERYCNRRGSVMVGMKCSQGHFCDTKKVLCRGVVRDPRRVSGRWRPYQLPGGTVADTFTVSQTSEQSSSRIFSRQDTWSVASTATIDGEFKLGSASFEMTASYESETFQQLEQSYAQSLTDTWERTCSSNCNTQGKVAWIWRQRAELADGSAYFDSPPDCLVRCVAGGLEPQCPPTYCGDGPDGDCQCCSSGTSHVLVGGGYQICDQQTTQIIIP